MNKQRPSSQTRTAHVGQKRCQYLALLGLSLFSVALVQEKAVTAQAADSSAQTGMVVKRVAPEGKASPAAPVAAPAASKLTNDDEPEGEQPQEKPTPSESVTDGQGAKSDSQENSLAKSNLVKQGDTESEEATNSEQPADEDSDHSAPIHKSTADPTPTPYKEQVTSETPATTTDTTPAKAAKGKVYVRYVTDHGGELLKKVMTGHVGEKFTAESLKFTTGDDKDFMLTGASRISGIYSTKAQTVTFVYRIPWVRATSKNGLNIFTITYGDGSLKSVQIYDGDFEIDLVKDAQGRPVALLQVMGALPVGKRTYFSANEVIHRGKSFGLFNTKKYSYIFEKADGGSIVKVLKINQETGRLTVQNISSQFEADQAAKALAIEQSTTFEKFWHQLVASQQQDEGASYQNVGTALVSRNQTIRQSGINGASETSTSLPQTSEKTAKISVLGYVGLFVLGVMGFWVKRERQR